MLALELLTADFPTLKPEDTLKKAKSIFEENCICHIPVVQDGLLQGILPLDLLLDENKKEPVSKFKDDWMQVFAFGNYHGLEVFEIIAKAELTAVPVVDENHKYLGTIISQQLMNGFSNYYSFKQIGGIIELKVGLHDYDLSEIARIVEANNARIIMQYMNIDPESDSYKITLKLDTLDLSHILATFDRYKYIVTFYHPYLERKEELDERYRLLMKLFDIE